MKFLCVIVGLILVGCLCSVTLGCRAILRLCGGLNPDQRNGYRVQPEAKRPAPRWIGGRK